MAIATIPNSILESTFKGRIIDTKTGNSGKVYIVEHEENTHPRRVAFKSFKLRADLTDLEIGYFLEECELWFTIKNPYIIVPFYAEVIGGQPFLCMPYCETDLKTLMLEQELTEISALVLSCRLIKALVEMRKSGVSQHQDLNPPNVLVQDLCMNFPAHPQEHHMNYDLKISDFGIANLREKVGPTIGGGGGKYPFKAPEQYDTHKHDAYEPDIFALGIMLYMLLTGEHPNGLTNSKALHKNTRGSLFKDWTSLGAGITYPEPAVEKILNGALRRDPAERPKPEAILSVFMATLKAKNDVAYQYLQFRFDYQDRYHQFTYELSRLHNLGGIAALPGRRKIILRRFLNMLEEQQPGVSSATELIYYGRTLQYTDGVARKNDEETADILRHALFLLKALPAYRQTLTVDLQYPVFDFPGYQNWRPQGLRDYEVPATYASLAIGLIGAISGVSAVQPIFEQLKDPFLWSLYYYHLASKNRSTDFTQTLHDLDSAKTYWPDEPVFDAMRDLWMGMQ